MNNLKIELEPREDGNQEIYYVGKLNTPVKLDASQGLAFLIFISDNGDEELQIAFADNDTHLQEYFPSKDRLKIRMEKRKDRDQRTFYLAKVKFKGEIDCTKEPTSFLVFISKPGHEMLQISGPVTMKSNRKTKERKYTKKAVILQTDATTSLTDQEFDQFVDAL